MTDVSTSDGLPTAEELAQLPPDGGPDFNRLVFARSPYLLQHARNPVDWYPWGDEAFDRARREDKPVFLSIGYSTCHWCHVMERESFEDAEIAALLNTSFIAIKVDREERPDVDQVYMSVTQALTGGGGWPMTVLLTPQREPFFAGTYFPRASQPGRVGLLQLLTQLDEVWRNQRERVTGSAAEITRTVREALQTRPGDMPTDTALRKGGQQLADQYDRVHAGFGTAPKFPAPHQLVFLLRYAWRYDDEQALAMVRDTLWAMRQGGIYDHVGQGFHRYATDAAWRVPHFEKMLYDQALLLLAYVEAFELTREPFYEQTAHEIVAYVQRELSAPAGGFYSAEDADSEGEEGRFYVWTADELATLLDQDEERVVRAVWNVTDEGNYIDEASGRPTGTNILYQSESLQQVAERLQLEAEELLQTLERARAKLFTAREKRVRPHRDDKVLTDWNGLMLAALARAGRVLQVPEYVVRAQRAAAFVHEQLRGDDGRLCKSWRDGSAGGAAVADDYAFLAWGLWELYDATLAPAYINQAREYIEVLRAHFRDDENGGYFLAADDGEALWMRSRDAYDGAVPSANSVLALQLLRLGRLCGAPELEQEARRVLQAFGDSVNRVPVAHCQLLLAVDFLVGPVREIVIVGDPQDAATQELVHVVRERYLPHRVLVLRDGTQELDPVDDPFPHLARYTMQDGRATAYVCRNYSCQAPVTSAQALAQQLDAS